MASATATSRNCLSHSDFQDLLAHVRVIEGIAKEIAGGSWRTSQQVHYLEGRRDFAVENLARWIELRDERNARSISELQALLCNEPLAG